MLQQANPSGDGLKNTKRRLQETGDALGVPLSCVLVLGSYDTVLANPVLGTILLSLVDTDNLTEPKQCALLRLYEFNVYTFMKTKFLTAAPI
jgi:hypothetical protein